MELNPSINDTDSQLGNSIQVDESLIEEIWRDLEGRVTQEQIRQVAYEVAGELQHATVTAFVPIFLQRLAREKLELLINESD
jgi:hypothetical protein